MIKLQTTGLNIVLYQPEIPANTGNIGRLCVGTNSRLHLIKPFRFFLDDKSLKRAGLDYWKDLDLIIHESLEGLLDIAPISKVFFCTTKTGYSLWNRFFYPGDFFVFGPESKGLPENILEKYSEQCISIPMTSNIRSINLSNSVSIVLYEALRQINCEN